MEHGLLGGVLGLALFLFPGVAWTLALGPGLGWVKAAGISVVMAFTLAPATLFLLSVLFDVPLRLATMAFLAAALGMAGVAMLAAKPLRAALRA